MTPIEKPALPPTGRFVYVDDPVRPYCVNSVPVFTAKQMHEYADTCMSKMRARIEILEDMCIVARDLLDSMPSLPKSIETCDAIDAALSTKEVS